MAINERLVHTASAAAAAGAGTGNQEEGLILHLDANDVDSYDGDGSVWYDIKDHEFTPAVDPSEHFNTVTYTGNGTSNSTEQSITGVGFQPDLVWIKNRGESRNNVLVDSLRKTGSLLDELHTNTTDAANTTGTDNVKTMDSDGFTVLGQGSETNDSGDTFVAWCFKAGGAPTASTPYMIDGTGYATLSAAGLADDGDLDLHEASINTKLGFGIYRFDPNTIAGETNSFEHGLGSTPELIITKSASGAYNWWTFTNQIDGSWDYLKLNGTDAKINDTYTSGNFADNTTMRFSSVFTGDSSNHVAYAFTSKRGVSKVGSYTGTGAAGNKIYTGFEPAFIMMKKASTTSDWHIVDNKTSTAGRFNKYLRPNTNEAEVTPGTDINIHADGFSFNGGSFNSTNVGWIYLAFAAEKATSLIDDTDLEQHLDPADTNSYSGTGTSWNDLEGTHANATVTASTYDEELGNSFDITSNTITLSGDAGSLDGTSFTFETWLWQDSNSGTQYFFSDTGISFFTISATQMRFIKYLSGTNNDTSYFNPANNGSGWGTNKWNHVAVTFSSYTAKIYINGILVHTEAEGSGTGTAISTYQISPSLGRWKGKIGQYRVYSTALTADEVMQNYRFTKNAYPNGNNGTIAGSVSWTPNYFNFPASDGDGVRLRNDSLKLNTFSISMWVNPDTFAAGSSYNTLFETYEYSGSSKGYLFHIRDSGQLRFAGYNGDPAIAQIFSTNVVLSTGAWQHIVVVFDSTANIGKLYVGGSNSTTEVSSYSSQTTGTIGYLASGHETTIGALRHSLTSGDTESEFDGKISKVKVYDKVLTQAEITALYDEGE